MDRPRPPPTTVPKQHTLPTWAGERQTWRLPGLSTWTMRLRFVSATFQGPPVADHLSKRGLPHLISPSDQ